MSIIISMSNVGAKLVNADQRAISIVSDTLSYDVDGAQFVPGFREGSWNGRSTFLKFPHLIFEAGFVPMVKRALIDSGYSVSIHDTRVKVPIAEDDIELDGITLRDYQADAISELEKYGRGIVQVATGGGKTEIAIAATKRFGVKTLFLTHKLDLVRQTRKRYHDRLGKPVGMISEGEWLPSNITVATVQTIMAHWRIKWLVEGKDKAGLKKTMSVLAATEKSAMKSAIKRGLREVTSMTVERDSRAKVVNFLNSIEFLIVDEAHRSSAKSFFTIITSCISAYYRLSITATPLMKGSREDDLKLIACSGDVIYRITNKDLIDRGYLAEPHFTFIQLPAFALEDGTLPKRKTPYPTIYAAGIVNNDLRNSIITQEAQRLVEKQRQTVILVKEIKHGKNIESMLKTAGIRCKWVHGGHKGDQREEALKDLRERRINVLISSTILDEGLDEDSISAIILAGGEKSQISLFQRVGRAMRARKGDDLKLHGNTAEVIDFIDGGHHHLMKHSALRFSYVKSEDGWVIDGLIPWENYVKMNRLSA